MTMTAPQRLINNVAVGLVFVNGPSSPYRFNSSEATTAIAEVQEGLDWLGQQEPLANVTWTYNIKIKTVNITPFEGANWPGLPDDWYRGIDAALMREGNHKIYLFRGSEYVRYSKVSNGIDSGYPRPIAGNWKGLPASFNAGIDAALWRESNKRIYFFKGPQYVRVNPATNTMDAGYPKPIAGNWPGLPSAFNAGIDAALMRGSNGKIYMFKDDNYVRFSSVSAGVDPGYPTKIAGNWKGLPDRFNKGINAALWRESNGKIYFFKGRKYARIAENSTMDSGYPRPIGLTSGQMERLWRDPAMAQLGHPGSGGVKAYAEALKNAHGTDTAYVAFFTKWPIGHFAYAGWPRVVMDFNVDGWGPTNMDRVFAHETGHIFGAPDEYASSGCKCDSKAGRFIRVKNSNCANCSGTTGLCIMKSNSPQMCTQTPFHLGWGAFLDKIDAALWRDSNDRVYLFSGRYYLRLDDNGLKLDSGYPRLIKGNWKGMPASFNAGIDAAVRRSNGKIYFFKGSQYVRIDNNTSKMDPGYPVSIAGNWKGMPASFNAGIDAAVRRSNGKIYFFKGSQYVRMDDGTAKMDPGYPVLTAGNWKGMPASFNAGIDAAVRRGNGKIYFFKGTRYVRMHDSTAKMDPGYPRWINRNWVLFPR